MGMDEAREGVDATDGRFFILVEDPGSDAEGDGDAGIDMPGE